MLSRQRVGAELRVAAGGHAECCLERSGEMRLVGEACVGRCLGQWPGLAQPGPGVPRAAGVEAQ